MLIRSSILVELAAVASSADILVVPEHEQYTGAINLGSIVSDDEIVAELDYLEFKTDRSIPSGVNLICPDCPFAVQGTESDKYTFTDTDVQTIIEVVYDTANNRLNLNGNPFLGSQLEDLHLPQTTVQSASFPEDYPEAYTGPLPITYNEQVVQVRTIQLQDGSLVEFYSIDVEVLSIGGRPINVAKVNSHIVKRGDGEVCTRPRSSACTLQPLINFSLPSYLSLTPTTSTQPYRLSLSRTSHHKAVGGSRAVLSPRAPIRHQQRLALWV